MKSRYLIATCVLLGTTCSAFAFGDAFLTSDLTTIAAGGSITFSVVVPANDIPSPLPVIEPGIGSFTWAFSNSSSTFRSGDGQQQTVFLNPSGGSATFSYLTPGDYTASVNGILQYSTLGCTPSCQVVPNSGAPYTQFLGLTETITVTAAVPEPGTWLLLLIGFALVAKAGRRGRSWSRGRDLSPSGSA